MFGFLRADSCDADYRRLYAGCCSFQHREFGLGTLPLLSYEGAFLYVLAVDAGACSPPDDTAVTCCRLRQGGTRLHPVDETLATFCSCFGLLLASVKLEDDVRDDRSLLARLALWRLRSRIRRAKDFFETLDPSFQERIEGCIADHLQLEQRGARPSLEEYARPTGDAFGYLFGLYAKRLPPGRLSESWLREIGAAIGKAIIAHDCAADWERDRRRGRYNPLPDREAVEQARAASQRWLSEAGWQCAEAFGPHSRAARVIRAAFDRIGNPGPRRRQATLLHAGPQRQQGGSTPGATLAANSSATLRAALPDLKSGANPTPARPRWFMRRGDCDCFCDPSCCDVSACDGNCCDCPSGGDNSFDAWICCCPDCYCDPYCCWGSRHSRRQSKDGKQPPGATLQGQFGRTVGPLNPAGVARLNGGHLPARVESGSICDGAEVEIVKHEPFGVIVRAASSGGASPQELAGAKASAMTFAH